MRLFSKCGVKTIWGCLSPLYKVWVCAVKLVYCLSCCDIVFAPMSRRWTPLIGLDETRMTSQGRFFFWQSMHMTQITNAREKIEDDEQATNELVKNNVGSKIQMWWRWKNIYKMWNVHCGALTWLRSSLNIHKCHPLQEEGNVKMHIHWILCCVIVSVGGVSYIIVSWDIV